MRCLWGACERSQSMQQALASMEEELEARLGYRVHREDKEDTCGTRSQSATRKFISFKELGFGWWEPRGRDLNSDSSEIDGTEFGETGFGYWQPGIQTLRARERVDYPGNVVVSDTVALEGNGSRESHQGAGYSETDTMYTLNTVEQHSVCYSIPAFNSGGMISDNPNTGYNTNDVARTLDTMGGDPTGYQGGIAVVQAAPDQAEPIVLESNQNHATITDSGISPTLSASMGLGGGYVPMITAEDPSVYPDVARTLTARYDSSPCIDRGQEFVVYESHDQDARYTDLGETCSTVSAKYGTGDGNAPMVVSCGNGQSNTIDHPIEELARTLDCMHDQQIICAAVDCRNGTEDADTNGTFQAKPNGGTSLNYNNVVRQSYIVRRLTPLEAERLQGLPDRWTDIGEWVDSKGKKHRPADAPRYKAIGNGIAVPPWLWVLSRLNQYCGEDKTMASLFNGISTFPLIWSFLNGKECCSWSSEVDEFCIALSKIRFPDTDE